MIGGGGGMANCISAGGVLDPAAGVTPRAVVEIFRLIGERTSQINARVEVQMFQLYR